MASPLKVARPDALLVAVALASVAPVGPDAISAVTVVPPCETGAPLASAIWIAGWVENAEPLVADDEGATARTSCEAWGAGPVTVIACETAAVSPAAENRSVNDPAGPLRINPEKRPTPPDVVADVVPLRAPPLPDAIAAEMTISGSGSSGLPARVHDADHGRRHEDLPAFGGCGRLGRNRERRRGPGENDDRVPSSPAPATRH